MKDNKIYYKLYIKNMFVYYLNLIKIIINIFFKINF